MDRFTDMSSIGKIQFMLIVVVCVMQLAVFVRVSMRRVHVGAFASQLRKLVDAGNPERALKLCAAAPGSPVTFLAKIGVEAHMHHGNAYEAMRAAYPNVLRAARSPLLMAIGFGAVAFADGLVLVVANPGTIASWPLLLLSALGAANILRRRAYGRELAQICDALR